MCASLPACPPYWRPPCLRRRLLSPPSHPSSCWRPCVSGGGGGGLNRLCTCCENATDVAPSLRGVCLSFRYRYLPRPLAVCQRNTLNVHVSVLLRLAALSRSRPPSCRPPSVRPPQAPSPPAPACSPPRTPPPAALCLYRKEDIWTYEVCYRKHARQFRQVRRGFISLAHRAAHCA